MKILAMVLAGGQGSRLHPLTAERSKPAVPFGSSYRIVDFVLSNLVNSRIGSIYVLVQYKSQSMIEHVNRAWDHSHPSFGQFVTIVPPQMQEGPTWFEDTADAIAQNINLIHRHSPDMVAIFGADHVYRMNVQQMVDFHHAKSAHITVAALPVPIECAHAFGVIKANSDERIEEFVEKPAHPPAMPGNPSCAFASMGNYLFNTEVLLDALVSTRQANGTDFGRHILPQMTGSHRVFAYDYGGNRTPGLRAYEEKCYWRDVGTIDAYYQANRDMLGVEPRFDVFNQQWLIRSSNYDGPSPRIVRAEIDDSTIGAGTVIQGARIRNSIIRRGVVIEEGVEIDDCIVMDYTVIRRGARLRRAIVDVYNTVPAGATVGFDPIEDRRRCHVSPGGVVVLPQARETPDVRRYCND